MHNTSVFQRTSPVLEIESLHSHQQINSNINLTSAFTTNPKFSHKTNRARARAPHTIHTPLTSSDVLKVNNQNIHMRNLTNANESIYKKRISKYNVQKSLKDLHTILFIKKNARKFSLMSPSISMKNLNQYHFNLIGDKTCKILNKRSANYSEKFRNLVNMMNDDSNEKYELYDEMLMSVSPTKMTKSMKINLKKTI